MRVHFMKFKSHDGTDMMIDIMRVEAISADIEDRAYRYTIPDPTVPLTLLETVGGEYIVQGEYSQICELILPATEY